MEILRVLLIGLGSAGLVGCAWYLVLSASATNESHKYPEHHQRRRR
jgi:hypothetical protein